jgi:hypothetical protein
LIKGNGHYANLVKTQLEYKQEGPAPNANANHKNEHDVIDDEDEGK